MLVIIKVQFSFAAIADHGCRLGEPRILSYFVPALYHNRTLMKPIKLNRSWQADCRQALFVQQLARHFEVNNVKQNGWILAAISIIFIILSAVDGFQGWYYLTILLFWLVFGIDAFVRTIIDEKMQRKIRVLAQRYFKSNETHYLLFNESRIRYTVQSISEESWEITWRQFIAYFEEPDAIHLIPADPANTCTFSEQLLGEEALLEMKQIAKKTLPSLQIYLLDPEQKTRFTRPLLRNKIGV